MTSATFYVMINLPDFTASVFNDGKRHLEDENRHRQDRHADADHDHDDEIHHRQSDLARAAVDHQQRVPAGDGAGSDRDAAHGSRGPARQLGQGHRHLSAARRRQRRGPPSLQLPQQIPGVSARHAGQIHVRLSPSARSATAACARRIRRNTPRCCCRWCARTTATPRNASRRCSDRTRSTSTSRPSFPIHVTYQTAFVDDDGKLELRDDIYGRDRELLAILHNPPEMKIADIPVEHRSPPRTGEILSAADHTPPTVAATAAAGRLFRPAVRRLSLHRSRLRPPGRLGTPGKPHLPAAQPL